MCLGTLCQPRHGGRAAASSPYHDLAEKANIPVFTAQLDIERRRPQGVGSQHWRLITIAVKFNIWMHMLRGLAIPRRAWCLPTAPALASGRFYVPPSTSSFSRASSTVIAVRPAGGRTGKTALCRGYSAMRRGWAGSTRMGEMALPGPRARAATRPRHLTLAWAGTARPSAQLGRRFPRLGLCGAGPAAVRTARRRLRPLTSSAPAAAGSPARRSGSAG